MSRTGTLLSRKGDNVFFTIYYLSFLLNNYLLTVREYFGRVNIRIGSTLKWLISYSKT
jgi:hypothetical protein